MIIVDLGCAPGGWLQVISEIVNKEKKGKIIGVDLLETDILPDVEILVGNINDQIILDKINGLLEGGKNYLILAIFGIFILAILTGITKSRIGKYRL